MLKACKRFVTAIRRDTRAKTVDVEFSKGEISADLNGLYSKNRIEDVLERKSLTKVNSVLPFLADFVC